jgi:hypothetical protein
MVNGRWLMLSAGVARAKYRRRYTGQARQEKIDVAKRRSGRVTAVFLFQSLLIDVLFHY